MKLSCIWAMSENRIIGRDGDLPWRLSADLQRFKALTMGHHIIMGRKTFESIGRVLPGRTSVVITRQADYAPSGVVVAHGLDEAIQAAAGEEEVFVIGGARIYFLALPRTERIYLTLVHADVGGDVFFSKPDEEEWTLVKEERHSADGKNAHDYSFRIYDRAARRQDAPAAVGTSDCGRP